MIFKISAARVRFPPAEAKARSIRLHSSFAMALCNPSSSGKEFAGSPVDGLADDSTCSLRMEPDLLRMSARSRQCSNSRTFPGQSPAQRCSLASSESEGTCSLQARRAAAQQKLCKLKNVFAPLAQRGHVGW